MKPLSLTSLDEDLFWPKVNQSGPSECWLWRACVNEHGYGVFNRAKKRGSCLAHRVALTLALGRELDGFALHTCDTPACCNPAHLREGTHSDNMKDMVSRGRSRVGARNHNTRLTYGEVEEIRRRVGAGEAQREIAREYGIVQPTVSKIALGQRRRRS